MPPIPYPNSGAHLLLSAIEKHFATQPVLRGLDLVVRPGEFLAIVGRSGCGKSTLLRLLAGLDLPSAGSIIVDGKRLTGLNRTARMMFQDARLLPWLKVDANVALGLEPTLHKEGERLLREVGLLDRAKDWPAILSGGQRQRVALARALASHPRLLLLDEPLGSVDALTRIEMQQLIEELWQEKGFTGILVTHDVEEAAALADRVLVMENGRVAMTQDIDLPRPRGRGDARFGAVVQSILDRVMLSHRNASKETPDGKPDNTPHSRSTEQALESARLCQSTGRA